jgi:hypothetical protein
MQILTLHKEHFTDVHKSLRGTFSQEEEVRKLSNNLTIILFPGIKPTSNQERSEIKDMVTFSHPSRKNVLPTVLSI